MKKIIERLFEAREQSHIFHLQTKSHVEHEALGSFYNDINENIDLLVEVYQGQYGILEGYELIEHRDYDKSDIVKYFKELGNFILENKEKEIETKDSHLLSIIDDVLITVFLTVYKLENLK